MKKLINEFLDRITPKLPEHCAIEPVREPNTIIVEEKTPTPMTEKEKLVINKLYALLERDDTKIIKYRIITVSGGIEVYSYKVLMNEISILDNPSDEASEELQKIINKIVEKGIQEKLNKFLNL